MSNEKCTANTTRGNQCKNNASPVLAFLGVSLCQQHYGLSKDPAHAKLKEWARDRVEKDMNLEKGSFPNGGNYAKS